MGATSCLNATLRKNLAGLVFIAGDTTVPVDGLSYPENLINPGMPKLFIVAEKDRYAPVRTDTPMTYNISPQPKQLITYPETVHGTELFDTGHGSQFWQHSSIFSLRSINSQNDLRDEHFHS